MMKKKSYFFIFLIIFVIPKARLQAQESSDANPAALIYIEEYQRIAMSEMERTGVPASITLAQGLLESGNGQSHLSLKSNNHFGIKCKKDWNGERVHHDDDAKGECFRKYTNVEQSYIDHSDFLKNSPRYATLFTYDVNNYKSWARGLKAAGYATNPEYAQRLITLIEKYNLDKFTLAYWASVKYKQNKPTLAKNEKLDFNKSMDTVIEVIVQVAPVNEEGKPFILSASKKEVPILIEKKEEHISKVFDQFKMGEPTEINRVPAIMLPKGFSLLRVAELNNIPISQIYRFNDLSFQAADHSLLTKKMLIYLAPKRNKGTQPQHTVRRGETLHEISQIYGIKLKKLLQYNRLKPGENPRPQEVLYLRSYAPSKPTIDA